MTTTMTTTRRRIAAVVSGAAALALLVGPLTSSAATASAEAEVAAPMTAQFLAPNTFNRTATPASRTAAPALVQSATAAADFSSIFAGQAPALVDSGWAMCATPITWSVDTGALSGDDTARTIANMQWAFDQWTQASGLSFQYVGTTTLAYDDASFSLTPADGSAVPARHIYLAIVADADSDRMGGGTVGLGSPSQVWPSSKEIVQGEAVFRTDHVKKAGNAEAKSLFMHELGHVLGLAHATETANIMYPVVTDHTELGAGDIAGVRTMAKPCAA
jgi:hypothetical protein